MARYREKQRLRKGIEKVYALRSRVYNSLSLDARELKSGVIESLDKILDALEGEEKSHASPSPLTEEEKKNLQSASNFMNRVLQEVSK